MSEKQQYANGSAPPPYDSNGGYPPAGQYGAPPPSQYPPPQGGAYPPGAYPPPGQYPPPQGQYPPPQGQYPPPGTYPAQPQPYGAPPGAHPQVYGFVPAVYTMDTTAMDARVANRAYGNYACATCLISTFISPLCAIFLICCAAAPASRAGITTGIGVSAIIWGIVLLIIWDESDGGCDDCENLGFGSSDCDYSQNFCDNGRDSLLGFGIFFIVFGVVGVALGAYTFMRVKKYYKEWLANNPQAA
eukprot:Clim_evm14s209 gene=Clim_evmTU14s209